MMSSPSLDRGAPQVRAEELANSAPGILGGRFVVLRAGDAGQETKQQGGIGRVVVVHEAVPDSRIDLHVVRHVVLAQQPAQTPSGTPPKGVTRRRRRSFRLSGTRPAAASRRRRGTRRS
jgi:hypothetical protein